MSDDLVDRLRSEAAFAAPFRSIQLTQAADEIAALQARVAELETERDAWQERAAMSVRGRKAAEALLSEAVKALESAQKSIVTFMGVHGYPMESGAGLILQEVNAVLAKAKGGAE